MVYTSVERIPGIVSGLRHSFGTGHTRPEAWRRDQLQRLRALLIERGPDFERALHADLGKSPAEAQLTEIGFLLTEIEHTLDELKGWMRPRRVPVPLAVQPAAARVVAEPLGVVLIIAPWNYPLMLALSPLIGAIAAGNAAIVKPSELAPATSELIARLLPDVLDRRAVAVVTGGVPETTALLAERFDHIFYTGNGRVGRIVARAAAEHLTPITLELGGKSPVFVDDTVPLADAARRIVWGKFMNAGQTCIAPDYVLGTAEVLRKLGPALVAAIHDLYGTATAGNPDYGRIITDAQFARLIGYLEDGEILTGGEHDAETRWIAPTVLGGVSREAQVMQDEIFGPILPLVEVAGLDDALEFVTARDKPLAAYVFSDDRVVRSRWENETSSGALNFGTPALHLVTPELPFGGVGESGMGAYHGERSFLVFSHEKAVLSKPLRPETLAATIMPPFTRTKEALARGPLQKLL
ncbi:aldehyde dehydrogenase family protein [Leucobacter chromiireducens]|uniref:Aldehyde dehydrogenase n=1 Tax=Leucobacter chromiireducens subsp. chromiireducens TaxID=660067 RepID=A0ABS1SPL9_9MICO|nr:aldehyde dehydrogenase family protein [Leucobacter chromiireducens]MBL3690118.1 aldehyde dehydrogenase family protein [Leucobacter chromiireducens subsp. chromiireducens]